MTARMLAWKQPFIQRVRNSSLVEGPGMDNLSQSSLLYSLSKLREFFGSLYLRVVLCVSALCAIVYVAWLFLNAQHDRRPSKKIHRYGRPRD